MAARVGNRADECERRGDAEFGLARETGKAVWLGAIFKFLNDIVNMLIEVSGKTLLFVCLAVVNDRRGVD
jgi:hypothetical protein